MSDRPSSPLSPRGRYILAAVAGIAVALFLWLATAAPRRGPAAAATSPAADDEVSPTQVAAFCGACHATPPPDSFPREAWNEEVARGFRFFRAAGLGMTPPSEAAVCRYYTRRAPERLPLVEEPSASRPGAFRWKPAGYGPPNATSPPPAVSHVRFARFSDNGPPDLLACDMRQGLVLRLRPNRPLEILSDQFRNPAHLEVVDLDQDGRKDILVADLGSFLPSDEKQGSVVWLRNRGEGGFDTVPLAWGLGRVADVQAADFDGDGDLDLVVAVFGMHSSGEILLLENRPRAGGPPDFKPRQLDHRPGAIHVPVADLDHDGRPDFMALISQEHEKVVAFLNQGSNRFDRSEIYAAPHPAFGSSGLQLVDLDGDGDLDVLLTNGDVLDTRPLLRPEHGVRWLENCGGGPYREHRLAALYGASRAEAADLDGDGDSDIVAVSFLPGRAFRDDRRARNLVSILVLEQVEAGRFVRHAVETAANDHPTCALDDYDGDGRVDLAVGNFTGLEPDGSDASPFSGDWITLWKNVGVGQPRAARKAER